MCGLPLPFKRLCAGRGSVYDYQSVLRQIRYVNTNTDNINRRTFVLSCTEAGKHVASNMLAVNVSRRPSTTAIIIISP